MTFYTDLQADVLDMLTEFGQDAIVLKYEMPVSDPATGIVNLGTPTRIPGKGVLLDFNFRIFGDVVEKGTLIQASSKRIILSGISNLQESDHIVIDGDEYTIFVIKKIRPSGVTLLYDLWVLK